MLINISSCNIADSENYPISLFCASSAIHKIVQTQVKIFSDPDLSDPDCGMRVGGKCSIWSFTETVVHNSVQKSINETKEIYSEQEFCMQKKNIVDERKAF